MEALKIAKKIKNLREIHGIKQEEIAQILNISQNDYNKLETGQSAINFKKLEEIANIYNMSPNDLFNFDEKYGVQINNNHDNSHNSGNVGVNNGQVHNVLEKERELYERHIKQLQDENKFLKDSIEHLRKLIN